MAHARHWAAAAAALLSGCVSHTQVPDRGYRPPVLQPQFAPGEGPMVCVDEAHFNFHTLDGRFRAFGELLRRDGFRTRGNIRKFDAASLEKCMMLVISNAQPNGDEWDRYPYPTPSAFTADEIAQVARWVNDGGALLLIADHMPLAGAAKNLAAAFDVEFFDGFAMREDDSGEPDVFTTAGGTLMDHHIVRGRNPQEVVAAVRTFTGQAFRAPGAEPLLVFPSGYILRTPRVAWEFTPDTPSMPARDMLQAAVKNVGKGRAAFFGEAAMFSAQLAGEERKPMGMNAPGAEANFQFVLNVVHWLARTM